MNALIVRIGEEILPGVMDERRLVTANGPQLHALAANESAMPKAFHEGDRVYCGPHLDDIVIVLAE